MVLNKEQFEAYRMEIVTFGNIPILSKYCGIGCVFCKVHTDSYLGHYPKIPMIDMEDLLEGFKYINPNVNYVRLGAGVLVAPHTDPFLHPQIYDFIKIASENFPTKKITTVTTGAYIREDKLDFLNSISNFGIDLSLITMQGKREEIIPRSERERTMTLLKHAPLNKCTLMFTGDINDVKKDLELLYSLGVQNKVRQILVRRMEHTATSQPKLKELSSKCIANYEECISWVKTNYPDVIFTVPILRDAFRGGNNEYFIDADERIAKQKEIIQKMSPESHINLICSLSGYDYFSRAFKDMPNVKTNLILNRLYGGSVSVAGLLNHRDIKEQFIPEWNDLMIMPEEMYNADGFDLLGEHISELEKYYNTKIILA
ncbi:DUF512 domain-containing protein [Bacteroides cellulosilyticus]|uniref:DUF512 domain-containing protein n=1 Tax=Bacteroides cellulosilyticus TaxID=246787 RepID=UPI00189B136E|nr:DUF512 domain-containing protein [Bacteroides cellulosilyticus]